MRDLWAFDDAVKVALDFQKKNPDTLIIVTGDHETGGFSPTYGRKNLGPAGPNNYQNVGLTQLKMIEYAYAKKNKMTSISLKNKDGQFVAPDDLTFAAAAASTDWASIPGMGTFITNAPGAKSWPITGASFVLIYKNPENKANVAEVIKFFDFAFKDGKKMAEDLDYVPMPDKTTEFIRKNVFSKIATK